MDYFNIIDLKFKKTIIELVNTKLSVKSQSTKITKIKAYNWSYIIWIEINSINKYVIKVPKLEINQKIADATSNTRNSIKALDEYLCIKKLYDKGIGNINISVVKPMIFMPEINAFMLSEIDGEKLYELIKTKKLTTDKIKNILYRIGSFLRDCHRKYDVGNKRVILSKCRLRDVHSGYFESKIIHNFHDNNEYVDIKIATMLLGYEVRNIFYCVDTDKITIHDLQEISNKPVYEDLSQFIISLDLINFGTIFPFKLPLIYYQEFLKGYSGGGKIDVYVLSYFIIKEYLRFYKNSQKVLNSKYNIKLLRKVIMKMYHERWIAKLLNSRYWEQL